MKVYKILKAGNLMMLRAYIKGPEGKAYPKLLVDTGSAYTIIAHEFLEMIGCSPALCKKRRRVFTASGIEMLPVVEVCGNISPHIAFRNIYGRSFGNGFSV